MKNGRILEVVKSGLGLLIIVALSFLAGISNAATPLDEALIRAA